MNALLQQFLVLTRRSPLMVGSIATLLILAAVNYFLWQQQGELAQNHERARQDGEAMLAALTGHSRVTAQLASVQEALAYLDKNLIAEAELAENLNYFYQMEGVSRVRLSQLNQLSSQPPPEANPYKSVPFSLRATGSYLQIMSFVRALETGPRLLKIRTFSFSRSDAKLGNLALDLTVDLLSSP